MNYAVFIGRFQPFHAAHKITLDSALKKFDHVIIVLGSANAPASAKNPWSTVHRELMIRDSYTKEDNEKLTFVGVRDYPYDNGAWVADVSNKVNRIAKDNPISLIGSHTDLSSFYLDLFPHWKRSLTAPLTNLHATEIRAKIFENGLMSLDENDVPELVLVWIEDWMKHNPAARTITNEHLHLKSYKEETQVGPHPVQFITADCVVHCNGHILLVKRGKHPGKGLYALPGGFVDEHEQPSAAAYRELKEETGILVSVEVLQAGLVEARAITHPTRSQRGRVVTFVHHIKLYCTELPKLTPGDDAADAQWIPIRDIFKNEENFFDDHLSIIELCLMG